MRRETKKRITKDLKKFERKEKPSEEEVEEACRKEKISAKEYRLRSKKGKETTKDIVEKFHKGNEIKNGQFKKDLDVLEETFEKGAINKEERATLTRRLLQKYNI